MAAKALPLLAPALYGIVACALVVGWLVAAAWMVGRGASAVRGLPFDAVLALCSAAFAVLGGLLAGRTLLRADLWPQAALSVVAGVAFFAAVALAAGANPLARPGLAAVVLAGAAAEEFVFRVAAPHRLSLLLGAAWTSPWAWAVAQVAVQAAFAACHFATPAGRYASDPLAEGVRLFAAGLIYVVLVRRGGWWLALGTHAALNFALAAWPGAFPTHVDLWQSVLVGAAALAAVAWCGPTSPADVLPSHVRITPPTEEEPCA